MVAQNTVRTYGINQAIRFVEGIWLHHKNHQIPKIIQILPISHNMCAACSELPSHISTMQQTVTDTIKENK